MKKSPLFLTLLTIFLFAASVAFAQSEKYRIAVILPLSGQVASLGKYVRQGIELALETLPESERDKLEVIFEDDEFDPKKTITAYRSLRALKNIDAVFVPGSPPANALGPITEKDKVLLMAIGASDPTIAVGKKFSFIHWVIPPVLGEKLAEELARRDFQKIAFVASEVTGAIADIEATVEALRKRGMADRIVYHQNFPKEMTDFKSALTQMRQKKCDAVVTVLIPGSLSAFAKQFKVTQIKAELIGMETFEDEAEVKASGGALIDTWYVNATDNTPEFAEAYKKKFGSYPGWAAGNAYDSLNLVASALRSGAHGSEMVVEYLRSVKDYQGATGVFSASGDNRFTLPAALKRVTAGGFEPLR